MAGLGDVVAEYALNYALGVNSAVSRFMALFTAPPTADSGSGGTEVSTSGTAYARPQIAGTLTAGAAFTTSSSTITLSAAPPAWLLALGTTANPGNGVNVYDLTSGQQIGVVQSISGATVTLQANAAHASSGSGDSLQFSAFPLASASSGTEPSVTPASATNTAQANFAQATGSGFGTVEYVGLYDSGTVGSGNYLAGDYLGNFPWLPAEMTAASPGVISAHAHGYSNGTPLAVSAKLGGTIPTVSAGSLSGVLTAENVTTDTFTVQTSGAVAVNTSTSGDFMVREIVQQAIAANVTFYVPAGSFTLSLA